MHSSLLPCTSGRAAAIYQGCLQLGAGGIHVVSLLAAESSRQRGIADRALLARVRSGFLASLAQGRPGGGSGSGGGLQQLARRGGSSGGSGGDDEPGGGQQAKHMVASLAVVGGLAALAVGGVLMKDQIKMFLHMFIDLVERWGPMGYAAYIGVYAGLELLAVPAIPLTMTAGVIFGVLPGAAVVSVAATLAATGAFLIARYVARDRVAAWALRNPKFAAIDRAIGRDGFRVVALLRLSPLLPLAASNYLYGLTSVDLISYVTASWLGMLPGTLAYVAAGTYGREFFLGSEGGGGGGGGVAPWQVALGLAVSGVAIAYVGRLAKEALDAVDEEE